LITNQYQSKWILFQMVSFH